MPASPDRLAGCGAIFNEAVLLGAMFAGNYFGGRLVFSTAAT